MDMDPHGPGLRVVLYSHDSVGLGHTRRNLAIAHALADRLPAATGRRVSGLLITGERSATSYACPEGWDWVVMPGIRKSRGRYAPRTLNVGMGRLMDVRSSLIDGTLGAFRPHVMIVDRHAFGVDGELDAPLARLRRENPDCRVVLGLREVLDDPQTAAAEWARIGVDRIRTVFDELWVYGDPAAHDPLASGEIPPDLADLLRFTGYLSLGRHGASPPETERPFLVTMVGGGSDGFALTAAAAAASIPDGYRHLVVTGPQMPPAARRRVQALAAPGTRVVDSVPDGLGYVEAAAAVVVMGGYNTVCEVLGSGTPALVVPREEPRREQLIRASALAGSGAVDLLRAGDATPEALASWFAAAVAPDSPESTTPGPAVSRARPAAVAAAFPEGTTPGVPAAQHAARSRLDLDGLAAVASHAARLAAADARSAARLAPTGKEPLHATA
ncbi:glycosyltransferase family protein [Zafaria sp. J156]|uniref:glycosyltransferase family protein n=1 Tax=Zafaria sp. J156 TaxID=3116490 RepID=UPI003D36F8FB